LKIIESQKFKIRLRIITDYIKKDKVSASINFAKEVLKVVWNNPNEIKAQYKSASIIGDNKVVFNIAGNKYRLIVKINYIAGIVFIKFIGTHKQYDKIKVEEL